MKKLSLLIFSVAIIAGCSNSRNAFNGEFHSVSKPSAIILHADTLKIDMFGAVEIFTADTLMVAYTESHPEHLVSVYSFKTLTHYGNFIHKGRGPDEFERLTIDKRHKYDSSKTVIWMRPQSGLKLIRLNLTESIIAGKAVIDRESDVDEAIKITSAWRRIYVNDSISLLQMDDYRFECYNNKRQQIVSSFAPYVQNDNDKTSWGLNIIKPDGSKLAQTMLFFDQINICNLDGSDAHSYSFRRRPVSVESIGRGPGLDDMKIYYRYIVAENDYIIAVYLPSEAASTELHVFDWDGNALNVFGIPYRIEQICLDKAGNNIFGFKDDQSVYKINMDGHMKL